MKKIVLIGIAGVFVTIILGLFFAGLFHDTSQFFPNFSGQSPTPILAPGTNTSATGALRVISITPSDNEQNTAVDQRLVIHFNKIVENLPVEFSIFPPAEYAATASGNILTVIPLQKYTNNIIYTYTIVFDNQTIFTGHFFVSEKILPSGAPLPSVTPYLPLEGRYPDIESEGNTYEMQNHPDVFLTNNTPYQEDLFSIESSFVNGAPLGHYRFTVTLVGEKTIAKNAFFSWVHSLGLTQEETSTLDITYQ